MPVLTATGRFRFAASLTAAMAVATLTQFALGALAPILTVDLGLSKIEFGVLNAGYFLVAAVMSPVLGPLVDRVGGKRMMVAMVIWQAGALVAMAAAPGLLLLLGAAGLSGAAMAASNPITNQLAMLHLPRGERGLVMGVKQSGVWGGAVIAGVALAPIAARAGWRVALLVGAALSLVVAPLAILSIPARRDAARARRQGAGPVLPVEIRQLVPYAFLMGAGGAGMTAYLALFANESFGFSHVRAGATLGVLGIAGVVGRIAWGHRAEHSERLWSPLASVASAATASQAALALSGELDLEILLWVSIVALGITAVAWNAVAMVAIIRVVEVEEAGRASGVVLTGFYIGLLVGPLSTGVVLDLAGSYNYAWTLIAGMFLSASFVLPSDSPKLR